MQMQCNACKGCLLTALPRLLAITMGDPAGIGPEVTLRALNDYRSETCVPVVYGDAGVLHSAATLCGVAVLPVVKSVHDIPQLIAGGATAAVLHLTALQEKVDPGVISGATGRAAYHYITTAIEDALAGHVAGIVTGPIHKGALREAGVPYPGHTEIFAALTQADRACMMLTSPELTCSFVTTHVGFVDVPALLSVERILDVIELTHDAMRRVRARDPRLLVCGLNPHAGESGLFGRHEEEHWIAPAVEMARQLGMNVEGPVPPDTAFIRERRATVDAVICMYHDQGHIPLKALAFDVAVNTTLGLPIVRTSVDHGTACDIAGKGIADSRSMVAAIRLAERLISAPGAAGALPAHATAADRGAR